MIIHICGPIASGKSTLANELKQTYKNKIIVMDLDDLLNKFVKRHKFTIKSYQKYIYSYIYKHKNKPIIFVGINQDMGRSTNVYDVVPDYKLFINLNVKENVKRRFIRDYKEDIKYFFLWNYDKTNPSSNKIYNMWIKNEKMHTKRLKTIIEEISPSGLKKDINKFRNKYKKLGYNFMKYDTIIQFIKKLFKSL